MRKLASVQRVWNVEPIEGADRIELAHVLGWQCVVSKGSFKPMDAGVYFEIDSFLPTTDAFAFLGEKNVRHNSILGVGYRIRTMQFKGQVSQGLLLPLSAFPEIPEDAEIGTDVSDLLGVRKWEIEERATTGGTIMGGLPVDVPHTDETRVQSMPELIGEFAGEDKLYYITTKMDGSSHSLCIDETGFHVCGHNFEYKDDGKCSFYEFVKKRGFREKMEEYMEKYGLRSLTVQGEFCGPGIQKNRLKLSKPEWYVFTVRENGQRTDSSRAESVAEYIGAEFVPVEEVGCNLPEHYPTVEALLERAKGNYPNGGKKEGIVIRTVYPEYSPTIGGSLSMKVVNNEYLLKNNE